MPLAAHRVPRPQPPPRARALVFSPDPAVEGWIDSELADQGVVVRAVGTIREVVTALIDDPPPRAQLLIADVTAMSPVDVLQLHQIREQGWFGAIVAIGVVADELRASLVIDRVVAPFVVHAVRDAVAAVGVNKATTRMMRISG